jgi:Tfp pilus assembly protein PilX
MTDKVIIRRRGSMLIEVTMATVILIMIMSVALKVMGFAAHERLAALRRERASFEAANVMEQITALRYDEITTERASRMAVSDASRERLPGCELAVDVSTSPATAAPDAPAKRIAVKVRWRGPSGAWELPVRLTAWSFGRRGRT